MQRKTTNIALSNRTIIQGTAVILKCWQSHLKKPKELGELFYDISFNPTYQNNNDYFFSIEIWCEQFILGTCQFTLATF